MFSKNDKHKDEAKVLKEEKSKTAEDKAVEAKEARAKKVDAAEKTEAEKSFGDDQQTRYDPKDLPGSKEKSEDEKAKEKGLPPGQAVKVEQGHDEHIQPKPDLKELVKKDYSKDIKISSLVFEKPKQEFNNGSPSSLAGRPWTVLAVSDGKAHCLIQDPKDGLQKRETFDLKDLMLDEPV